MTEPQSPSTSTRPDRERPGATKYRGLWIRVFLFIIILLFCGWYSRIFHALWTSVFPRTCGNGNAVAFVVDFDAYPARLVDQDNFCQGTGDGACEHGMGDEVLRGECRNGRMHGGWSLANAKSGPVSWSGTYCDGWPCGEFRVRIDAEHENVFRMENLHLHGSATIWEQNGDRRVEFSGRYDRGRRVGRWVRRIEPTHAIHSAVLFDEQGIVITTSFYCTNGNLKEARGTRTYLFDSQGKSIAETSSVGTLEPMSDAGTDVQSLCPLP